MKMGKLSRAVVIAGLLFPSPIAWAQPLEVVDIDTTRAAVDVQVERLVAEVAARDPELAQEIERQSELCIRDFSDGRLDHEGFTRDIESFREVRDVMEQEYGERVAPTPEMMERMSQDMEQLMAERPELAEYAKAEFGEMMKEFAEHQMGPHEGMERMAEMFREMGGPEHFREMEAHYREMEAHYREMEAHYREAAEREYGARLDELAQHFLEGAPPPEGGHVPVEMHTIAEHGHDEGHWDGPDTDNLADHTHPLGTGPHTN